MFIRRCPFGTPIEPRSTAQAFYELSRAVLDFKRVVMAAAMSSRTFSYAIKRLYDLGS